MPDERPEPWQVLEERHEGDFDVFTARALRVRSPRDGGEHVVHLAEAADGVTVVAITPAGELVMVEQWRHPLQRLTLELPSGNIDPGETPEHAAVRELREETGFAGGTPERIGCLVLNPSWQTTRLYTVVIRGAREAGAQSLDPGEDVRVCRLSPD